MSAPTKAPEGMLCRLCGSNSANVSHDVREGWPSTASRRVHDCAPCYGEANAKSIFEALNKAADTDSAEEYRQALSSAIDDLQGLEVDLGGAGWIPIIVPYFTLEQIAMHKRLDSRLPHTSKLDDVW